MQSFFSRGKFPASINTTWVALIPKITSPMKIEEYRPISMVVCLYKIISKVLAGRIKPIMNDITNEAQSGFVQGRQIMDGVIVASEAVSWLKKRETRSIVKNRLHQSI